MDKRAERAERVSVQAKQTENLKRDAETARAFRLAHPTDEKAAGALHKETKNNLLLGLLSEGDIEPDVLNQAEQAAGNPTLTETQRFELASLFEMAARKNRKFPNREAWLKSCEESARRLVAGHPNAPRAHEELLQVAAMNRGAKRTALAGEIVGSHAPEEIKAGARTLLLRESIGGSSLPTVLAGTIGSVKLLNLLRDRPLVLYTWRPEDQHSIARAQAIAAELPAGVAAIGINLSRDIPTAVAVAASKNLPGEQLTGGQGHDHPVTLRLGLTTPSLLYLVGRDKIVRNLSEEADLATAFAGLN